MVATLARSFGDLDVAEDAAAEAFASAVERWPIDGIPENPGAWLATVARHRAIDRLRRESTRAPRQAAAQEALAARAEASADLPRHGVPTDDRLRLVFTLLPPRPVA